MVSRQLRYDEHELSSLLDQFPRVLEGVDLDNIDDNFCLSICKFEALFFVKRITEQRSSKIRFQIRKIIRISDEAKQYIVEICVVLVDEQGCCSFMEYKRSSRTCYPCIMCGSISSPAHFETAKHNAAYDNFIADLATMWKLDVKIVNLIFDFVQS